MPLPWGRVVSRLLPRYGVLSRNALLCLIFPVDLCFIGQRSISSAASDAPQLFVNRAVLLEASAQSPGCLASHFQRGAATRRHWRFWELAVFPRERDDIGLVSSIRRRGRPTTDRCTVASQLVRGLFASGRRYKSSPRQLTGSP